MTLRLFHSILCTRVYITVQTITIGIHVLPLITHFGGERGKNYPPGFMENGLQIERKNNTKIYSA